MNKVGVGLLWLCVLLFVVCGTFLSIAAGLPKFAVYSKTDGGSAVAFGLGATASTQDVDIGAFTAVYSEDGVTYTANIEADCNVKWFSYWDTFFNGNSDKSYLCTQFNAFRSLLIVAVVFNFIIAQIIYTAILKNWLPPSNSQPVSAMPIVTIAAISLVPFASTIASFSLMIKFIVYDFDLSATYGVSFKLTVAAAGIGLIAMFIFVIDCVYCAYVQAVQAQIKQQATEMVAVEGKRLPDPVIETMNVEGVPDPVIVIRE
jgi:hypothetical protein